MIDVRNYQQPTTKITVYCEIKDKFEASSITSYEITIANSLSNGYYTIANALNDYTLPNAPPATDILPMSLTFLSCSLKKLVILFGNILANPDLVLENKLLFSSSPNKY